jgi:hypothetical protein
MPARHDVRPRLSRLRLRAIEVAAGASLLSLTVVTTASAQLITIRTVPISQSEQFEFFPSRNLGMGGVNIALSDTLLDPFRNPADASRLRGSRFFSSPGTYSVTSDAGAGRTLPVGAYLRAGQWFGGLALAVQQVDASRRNVLQPPIFLEGDLTPPALRPNRPGLVTDPTLSPGNRTHGNQFATLMLGRDLHRAGLSLAGSLSWSGLNAVDGVDLLYPGSQRVDQSGHALDLRLGLLKEFADTRSFQAVVLHDRFAMTHDVMYLDQFWDPATQQIAFRQRNDRNLDHTSTWGAHLEYQLPLAAPGWRLGWLATANHMSHPKIPNYEIMNIPGDPGTSNAFNLGVGVSRRDGPATFGMDIVYEPIWSHTWALADVPIATTGGSIPAGGKTVENHFRFSNTLVRLGLDRELPVFGGRLAAFQLGLMVRSIGYHLNQDDLVAGSVRRQNESWTEWTPTWGLSLRFPEFELRYRGSMTHGSERPTSSFGGCPNCFEAVPGGIVVAPSGPMSLDPVKVVSHQVSFSLPLR